MEYENIEDIWRYNEQKDWKNSLDREIKLEILHEACATILKELNCVHLIGVPCVNRNEMMYQFHPTISEIGTDILEGKALSCIIYGCKTPQMYRSCLSIH